jgi:hypothetical protein
MRPKMTFIPLLMLAWVVMANAYPQQATVTGTVRDSAGVAQMGAAVEILAGAQPALTVFTDDHGRYTAEGLTPGHYQIKATAVSFLPALRENVVLHAGSKLIVNLTLNTLFEAIATLPVRVRTNQDDDDWKWTLRSTANRPVLRVVDDGPLVVVSRSADQNDRVLKARVAFVAGASNDGLGSAADEAASFRVERSIFSTGTLTFNGNMASMGDWSSQPTVLHASYKHQTSDGHTPEVMFTMRRFGVLNSSDQQAALQALALTLSDTMQVMDFAEINYGAEYQTIQYQGRNASFRPFGSVAVHLSPDSVVEYRYATSLPNTRAAKGFDSAPADLSESGPQVTATNFVTHIEDARHQEVSYSRRYGKNRFQVAAFSDRINNIALLGLGNVDGSLGNGNILGDPFSQTFTYDGGTFSTRGFRAVAQRQFSPALTATIDYSYGGVLTLESPAALGAGLGQNSFDTIHRQAIAAKLAGKVPGSNTTLIASYKITDGRALTPVDAFNVSAGQADPYLNLFVRQPLPTLNFFPGQMEALIDVRNLLAEGYAPVFGQDGRTLYLVQATRSIRGGLAFSF